MHLGALKLVLLVSLSMATAVAVMDPTTKGYIIAGCIAAIPPTITGMFNHWKISAVEHKVDGMNAALTSERNDAVSKLSGVSEKLAHSDGRREGIESTEDKQK
jgi:hypothetical protein